MSFNSHELTLIEDQSDCSNNKDFQNILGNYTEAENNWYNDLLNEEENLQDPPLNDLNIFIMNSLLS